MSDPVAHLSAALDGRYAIQRELGEGGMATELHVILNWTEELKERVPN